MAGSSSSSDMTFHSAKADQSELPNPDHRSTSAILTTNITSLRITELTDRSPGPTILIISLNSLNQFEKDYKVLLERLEANADVYRATSCYQVVSWLERRTPDTILITDATITTQAQECKNAWDAVIEYMRAGGLAILCGYTAAEISKMNAKLSFSRAGLSWFNGFYEAFSRYNLHDHVSLPAGINMTALPTIYEGSMLPLYTDRSGEAIFARKNGNGGMVTAIAAGRIAEGTLIYVGNTSYSLEMQTAPMVFCGFSSPELVHFGPEHNTRVVETIVSEDLKGWIIKRADGSEEQCTYERHK